MRIVTGQVDRVTKFYGGRIMWEHTYPVLCGGTFFCLLLEARGQRTKKRGNAKGETDGLSQTDLLIELVNIIKIFRPPGKESTLKKNVSAYKRCEDNGGSYFAVIFESESDIRAFDERVKGSYNSVLSDMSALVDRFIGKDKAENLVKAMLELISQDKSIADRALFYIGEEPIPKSEIKNIDNVCLAAFILGIWHYIVTKVKDNRAGKATFEKWHKKKGEANSEWIFDSDIGSGIKRNINFQTFNEEFAEEIHIDYTPPRQITQNININSNGNIVNGFVFNLQNGGY